MLYDKIIQNLSGFQNLTGYKFKQILSVVVLLLCSLKVSGQESADSITVLKREMIDLTDSIPTEPENRINEQGYIFLSDSTDLATIIPIYDMEMYAKHSPAKAAMMSAVLPGLGQIYNRKYWKLPVVYAAVGITSFIFLKWQNEFSRFRRAYIDYNDGDPYTNYHQTIIPPGYYGDPGQAITKRKDQLRTWRDWSIVAVVAAYALNIIDANVDAHLIDFNLDDNISLNIQPCFLENNINSKKIALSLRFTF